MANYDPKWLRTFRQSALVIAAGLVGAVLATSFEFADKVLRITDRLHWTTSEALTLARESEKSKFSDALIRGAHRRLMLADIFARRVRDDAGSEQIEEAWKSYIAALIDWNADLMINIVGLETFYKVEKSNEFEAVILPMFVDLDNAMRSLYLDRRANNSGRQPAIPVPDEPVASRAQIVFNKTNEIRDYLYVFIRCFKQGQARDKASSCTIRALETSP